MDELLLTEHDAQNYRALCAAVLDRPVRNRFQRDHRDMLTPAQKLRKLQEQDYCCAECGVEFQPKSGHYPSATTEHVIPFRYGSAANYHNAILTCRPCNIKRDKEFSLELIERHYGPIDHSMIDATPSVLILDDQISLRLRAQPL